MWPWHELFHYTWQGKHEWHSTEENYSPKRAPDKLWGGRKGGKGDNVLHITEVLTLAELKVCTCAYRSHTDWISRLWMALQFHGELSQCGTHLSCSLQMTSWSFPPLDPPDRRLHHPSACVVATWEKSSWPLCGACNPHLDTSTDSANRILKTECFRISQLFIAEHATILKYFSSSTMRERLVHNVELTSRTCSQSVY